MTTARTNEHSGYKYRPIAVTVLLTFIGPALQNYLVGLKTVGIVTVETPLGSTPENHALMKSGQSSHVPSNNEVSETRLSLVLKNEKVNETNLDESISETSQGPAVPKNGSAPELSLGLDARSDGVLKTRLSPALDSNHSITDRLPEALMPVTFKGCCGEKGPFEQTCLTERACGNNSLYPFRSKEEADMMTLLNPTIKERRQHRRRCIKSVASLSPPTNWCSNNSTNLSFPFGCSQYSWAEGSGPYDRLLLFPEAKLAFCGMPKAGITKWVQFLRFTSGAKDFQSFPHFKDDHKKFLFDWIHPEVQQSVWREWTKAIFIREPAERLLSAFLDKVERRNRNPNVKQNVTFAQFVDFLATKNLTTKLLDDGSRSGLTWYSDPHWRPQAWSCGLSEHMEEFDYIGTVDHRLGDHTRALLDKVGLWESFGKHYRVNTEGTQKPLPDIPPPAPGDKVKVGFLQGTNADIQGHNTGSRKKMEAYYTPELLEKVKKLYWMDFAFWDALQAAAKDDLVAGKDIVGKLNPECITN